jgi:hypothetical protein
MHANDACLLSKFGLLYSWIAKAAYQWETRLLDAYVSFLHADICSIYLCQSLV